MIGERTPLANGVLFGFVTGFFGGSFCAFIFSVVPDEALIARRWILIVGGSLFWFFVGFLVGAFNAPRSGKETKRLGREEPSSVQKMLIAVGWFLYKLIVGYFVGSIASAIFSLIGAALCFGTFYLVVDWKEVPRDSPEIVALRSSMMVGMFCCFLSSVFGALMVTRRNAVHQPAISSQALRSSFLGILLGIPIGAALRLPPMMTELSSFISL